jgi:transposase InsO family protein
MPWKECSAISEQISFIEHWQAGETSFAYLCRSFGISRKTGYKRIRRFQELGWDGIADRSRAPHTHRNQTPESVIMALIDAKRSHPTWGPKKLVAWLSQSRPDTVWPAASTAGAVLDRAGMVQRRKRRRGSVAYDQPLIAAQHPNDVWSIDFKGWFRTSDGTRVDPLTAVDLASRYMLVCQGLDRPNGAQVRPVLERAFREYGLPLAIRSDNGPPFASTALGGLSALSVWWITLGITPERIEPGHPEQNGRLERLHRTLKAETANPPRASLRAQQKSFDSFRDCYNRQRPHEALGQQTPAGRYSPSPRPYPSRVPSPEYGPGVTARRVRTNGEIKWKGAKVYLSESLCGELVGLSQHDDRHWTIRFGPMVIGMLDQHAQRVIRTPIEVLPM